VLEFEDLKDVTLLGHSYGGMVATGVATRRPAASRVWSISMLRPKDGQSLFDLVGAKVEGNMRTGAAASGDGWRLPINPMPPDTSPEDAAGKPAAPAATDQVLRTEDQARVERPAAARHYITQRVRGRRRVSPVQRTGER